MVVDALEFLIKSIVRNPDDVTVTERDGRRGTTLNVVVNPEDLPRVIGRRGRTATAIRTVIDAIARDDVRVNIVDVD
ncbi:KH domain-containing protein [Demequina muriae]|uniref:RNA-binding protein KhpA n=1 Tax=Demequina muriae TaxID=3051664 RepID=A0ABT8GDX7_9MICO|nr:KH domain-containing protein [Demequina sp. EGI L300058]MDN4479625.1 KH domain-containing protein [Demequina sp. EGI L300058]